MFRVLAPRQGKGESDVIDEWLRRDLGLSGGPGTLVTATCWPGFEQCGVLVSGDLAVLILAPELPICPPSTS